MLDGTQSLARAQVQIEALGLRARGQLLAPRAEHGDQLVAREVLDSFGRAVGERAVLAHQPQGIERSNLDGELPDGATVGVAQRELLAMELWRRARRVEHRLEGERRLAEALAAGRVEEDEVEIETLGSRLTDRRREGVPRARATAQDERVRPIEAQGRAACGYERARLQRLTLFQAEGLHLDGHSSRRRLADG